jgi:DNA gyrase/topoisomerase IV subunit B
MKLRTATQSDINNLQHYNQTRRKSSMRFSKIVVASDQDLDG